MESKSKEKKGKINFKIFDIKERSFLIDKDFQFESKNLKIGYTIELAKDTDEEIIFVLITIVYKEGIMDTEMLKISVENKYKIHNLKNLEIKTKDQEDIIDLPDKFFILIVRLSIAHVRGILVKNTVGTNFEKYILPEINLSSFENPWKGKVSNPLETK